MDPTPSDFTLVVGPTTHTHHNEPRLAKRGTSPRFTHVRLGGWTSRNSGDSPRQITVFGRCYSVRSHVPSVRELKFENRGFVFTVVRSRSRTGGVGHESFRPPSDRNPQPPSRRGLRPRPKDSLDRELKAVVQSRANPVPSLWFECLWVSSRPFESGCSSATVSRRVVDAQVYFPTPLGPLFATVVTRTDVDLSRESRPDQARRRRRDV